MTRGSTLIEMTAMLAIAAMVFASAFEGLIRLKRLAAIDPTAGTRAEQACLQLRRDFAGGRALRAGAGLRVSAADRPAVIWQVEDGQLVRNGRLQAAVTSFSVEESELGVTVLLTPVGLPTRRIEGSP